MLHPIGQPESDGAEYRPHRPGPGGAACGIPLASLRSPSPSFSRCRSPAGRPPEHSISALMSGTIDVSLDGRVCYEANANNFVDGFVAAQLKIVDGTGRYEGATGGGSWTLSATIDDSGRHGTLNEGLNDLRIGFVR